MDAVMVMEMDMAGDMEEVTTAIGMMINFHLYNPSHHQVQPKIT
jgi:hypothetical protein